MQDAERLREAEDLNAAALQVIFTDKNILIGRRGNSR